jgi:hypothetical protein
VDPVVEEAGLGQGQSVQHSKGGSISLFALIRHVEQSQLNQFNQFLHMQNSSMQTDPENCPFATGSTDPPSP